MREDFHECPGPEGAAFLACQVGARPAIRTGDKGPALRPRMPPCLAYRGSDLAAVRSPTAAASLSARHAVGIYATGPSSSRWSAITRKSLITRASSAIAHARSAMTWPQSWRPGGDGSAADRPVVSPVLSASSRSRTSAGVRHGHPCRRPRLQDRATIR